jgi:ribosomal protein S18 acetylase RimI-like enzyme
MIRSHFNMGDDRELSFGAGGGIADLHVRAAGTQDDSALWQVIEPSIRAGETYPLPRDLAKADALGYWRAPEHEVFVAEQNGGMVGTYYLRANNRGGGAHVANCGYVVAPQAMGRGVARAMCLHSLQRARLRGFRAMQFNFVVASNTRAVSLWERCGFVIVGRLPEAFQHPRMGLVDALVMHRLL